MICPLCLQNNNEKYSADKLREYFLCQNCDLLFVPRHSLVSSIQEKERYDLHDNSADDPGYTHYLKRIADSIRDHLKKEGRGLDFGSGKTKQLASLLFPLEVHSFDLYFHPDSELLKLQYDFIILSEVIEHLREPWETMFSLNQILDHEGAFFIKTKLRPQTETLFSNWFYKRDITHIEFFSMKSLQFLGEKLGRSKVEKIGNDLFCLSNH